MQNHFLKGNYMELQKDKKLKYKNDDKSISVKYIMASKFSNTNIKKYWFLFSIDTNLK